MSYVKILYDTFECRKKNNPKYSLRAYARDIGISAAMLSSLFNSKRKLSLFRARAVAKKLNLTELDEDLFIKSVVAESMNQNKENKTSLKEYKVDPIANTLLKNWYHLALLEALNLKGISKTTEALASRLNLDPDKVNIAIEDLKKIQAIIELPNGELKDNLEHLRIADSPGNTTLRNFHQHMLEEVKVRLCEQNPQTTYSQSLVLGVPKKNLPKLKQRIKRFVNSLATLCEKEGGEEICAVVLHQVKLDSPIQQESR